MQLKFKDYYDKVYGCFYGKTIGGTLGAPFECYRGVYDVDFYVQDTSSPIPNDDVDLQLVWLRAVQLEGRKINSNILGEYWATYISASLCEYGTCKNNMKMGVYPPLCGHLNNVNKDSNGAWIRSEIWACLCPANPSLAAKYAFEDSSVDHSGEGVYGAVFFAAIQSAAFVENNVYKLLEIGLSYIPKDCGVAKAIDCVIDCYKSGKDFKEARKKVLQTVPGHFGMIGGYWKGQDYDKTIPLSNKYPPQEPEQDIPAGKMGYDAPSNIGLAIIGLLYGEGDFGKTICTAVNCGEDSDCTAGNIGALMGIIYGFKGLPEKWVKNCSDKISTWCLRIDAGLRLPKTVSELTNRIVKQTPLMLGEKCDCISSEGFTVIAQTELMNPDIKKTGLGFNFHMLPNTTHHSFLLHDIFISYDEELVAVSENKTKKLKILFRNNVYDQQFLTVRFIEVPEDWTISGGNEKVVILENEHGAPKETQLEVEILPANFKKGKWTIIMEVSVNCRMTKSYVPLTFLNGALASGI